MQPDYSQMSWKELRAYCLAHRDDLDALEAFFDRRSPDTEENTFKFAETEEEWKEQEKKFIALLEAHDRKRAQDQNS